MPPNSDYDLHGRTQPINNYSADELVAEPDKRPIERIDILAFPIDVNAVLLHLHRDMRDDWFEDVLQHRDLFKNKQALREVLHEVLLEGNGRYGASKRSICDIPKKGFGVRYALETDFYDRFIYQAICSYLIPFYDPLLSLEYLVIVTTISGDQKRSFSKEGLNFGRRLKASQKQPSRIIKPYLQLTLLTILKI